VEQDPHRTELARLRWRSRRGMRELDAVLLGFIDQAFDTLDTAETERLRLILDLPDPELYAYLVGRVVPEDPKLAELLQRIRNSVAPQA
jgi:antitoxin CptB